LPRQHGGDVLDVGCGDGLLAQRLAPGVTIGDVYRSTLGGHTTDERLEPEKHFTVSQAGFDAFDPGPRRFDLITFVASLHRMDLRSPWKGTRPLDADG